MQRFSSAVINIFQSPVVESQSLAINDQADPPLSLTEKHLFHVFTGLKINHHISIIDRASDISRCRGATKFTITWKIMRNSVEILSNTCLYNIFETYFSYRGYLLAVNLQIYLGTSSLKRANNVPKLPGGIWIFSSATYQKPCIECKHISTFLAVSSRMQDVCHMHLL